MTDVPQVVVFFFYCIKLAEVSKRQTGSVECFPESIKPMLATEIRKTYILKGLIVSSKVDSV